MVVAPVVSHGMDVNGPPTWPLLLVKVEGLKFGASLFSDQSIWVSTDLVEHEYDIVQTRG